MLLVTGGAGFIGSNLVAALSERGERVAVCDHLGHGAKWNNLAKRELEDIVRPADLPDFLAKRGGEVREIVHLGAVSDTTAADGDLLVSTNFTLSKSLWTWCSGRGVPFLYASSAATYGDGAAGFDDDVSADYLARLRPLNGYGWSKHLFDRWVARRLAEGEPRPPQWVGLKFFNAYGPNEYHKGAQQSVAAHLFRQVANGEPARLFQSHRPDFPDGGQRRDFIWVGDCVDVILWLLQHPDVSGLFNVGTGQSRTFAELARALFDALGQPQNIRYVPTPEEIRDKYQYFTEARIERLRAAGYARPFTPIEEGVGSYVRDFLVAPDPYR